jgi:hypothetical protein
MSIVLSPPIVKLSTLRRDKKYFTIQSSPNHVFTLNIEKESRKSIVGFKKMDDALLIGQMIETYYIQENEWPDTSIVGQLILPKSRVDILRHLYVEEWNFEDLKYECTKNILDLVSVERLINKKTGYTFNGDQYKFNTSTDFYINRFNELYKTD